MKLEDYWVDFLCETGEFYIEEFQNSMESDEIDVVLYYNESNHGHQTATIKDGKKIDTEKCKTLQKMYESIKFLDDKVKADVFNLIQEF